MRNLISFVAAAAAPCLLAGPIALPEARGEDAALEELAAPDADLEEVARRLGSIARRLRAGGDATVKGNLTIVSDRTLAECEAVADRLHAAWSKAAEALDSLGFATPLSPPALTVIVVRLKSGPTDWVRAKGDAVVLLREGDSNRPTEPAAVGPRADGAAVPRDAVMAARSVRLWQVRAQAIAAARSGETFFVARQAVAASLPRDKAPAWAYEGLISWTEQRIAPASTPPHVCKPWTVASPALVAKLLATSDASSPVASRLLGRFVGALFDGRADVPKLLSTLATASDAEAIGAAFGKSADAAVAIACAGLKDAAGTCDEKGQMACPACKGAGKLDLACADCQGTGGLACPSCHGYDGCPNDCTAGSIIYEGGKKVKCRVCTGGKVKCQACSGALRAPCKTCSGSAKGSWPCLACCGSGRTACPEAGPSADTVAGQACPWCQDASRVVACPDCGGIGYVGCAACRGIQREPCDGCLGTGDVRMVYSDGTAASSTKCKQCDGKGSIRCEECKNGRGECIRCGGKGRGKASGLFLGATRACVACIDGKVPGLSSLRDSASASGGTIDAEEAKANQAMLDRAIAFLLGCNRTSTGAFALRNFRAKGSAEAGALQEPTLFANAKVLWTLAVVGIDVKDARIARAWDALRDESRKIIQGTSEYAGTQAVALAIRAFAAGGEDPASPVLTGLVAKLVKGQHASGWWGDSLDGKDEDDTLDSLFAIEALRVARVKGVKVPRGVWQKALRAASSEFDVKGPVGRKADFMSAGEVCSNMALVIMAKEGSLGSKATSFDYTSMPAVKKGLAWLDRYFDIRDEATFVKGARYKSTSDAGYSAYIFAVQRLAMLLSIEVLAGERWHATGARYLASIQHKDGSFEESSRAHLNGPVRTTSSCVLFLARATTPITDIDDGE